jgi:NADPH:quinone reductase-like Zn-dependent oxidoreductase
MATQQKALWLKEKQAEFELGPKPIDTPGPGELLVKVEATALNPVGVAVAARRDSRSCCLASPTGRSRSTD